MKLLILGGYGIFGGRLAHPLAGLIVRSRTRLDNVAGLMPEVR